MNVRLVHLQPTVRALALAAALVGAAARAAESPAAATPSEPNATSDRAPGASIDAAKREYDAIKASRDPSQPQRGALPKLTMPELHTGAPEAKPWSPAKTEKPETDARRSGNWLVEAMEKDARQRKERGRGEPTRSKDDRSPRSERDEDLPDAANGVAPSRSREGDEDEVERSGFETKDATAVPNPLSRFLGEWMTPRDYALLKPGLEESLGARMPGERATDGVDFATPSSVAGINGLFGAAAANVPGSAPQTARENPYLQAMETPASFPAMPPPPVPHVTSTAPITAAPAPIIAAPPNLPPSVSTKSKIPEFAKPAQDEKYFKPLKRF